MTNDAKFVPLKEGLSKLTGVPGRGSPLYKKNPPVRVPSTSITELAFIHGAAVAGSKIGASPKFVQDAVKDGEATLVYELAAKWIRHRESVGNSSGELSMTRDQCLDGLLAYYEGRDVLSITPEDAARLSKTLGEILRELRSPATRATTAATRVKAT